VKLVEEPVQLFALGVTVTVAVVARVLLGSVAVNAGISPVPKVPNPTSTVLVHENVVPETEPLNVMAEAESPLQYVTLETLFTVGME
jgi:hypothetical protein